MTNFWTVKPLGELCEVIAGQSPPGKFYNDDGDGLPFYQGKKEFRQKHIGSAQKWTAKITKEAFKGDVLMSVRAPVGPINFATEHICIGRGLAAIRAGTELDKDFLYYGLLSKQHEIGGNAGAVFPSINKRQIESISFPFVSLPEQKRIVAILDKAFESIDTAIDNAEKNLQNAKELFDSYLSSLFTDRGEGWVEMTLKQAAIEFGRGKSKHRPRNDKKLFGGAYPFIQTGDVRNSRQFITSYAKSYNDIGLAQSKLWATGTICITIAANIAETGILAFDVCFPDSVIGMVVDEKKAVNRYVEYLLQFFKAALQAKGKGSAQDNINLATFANQLFPFPNVDEQMKIADNLDILSANVGSLETIYQQKLANLAELKQSILQKAFSGELTQKAA